MIQRCNQKNEKKNLKMGLIFKPGPPIRMELEHELWTPQHLDIYYNGPVYESLFGEGHHDMVINTNPLFSHE